MSTDLFPSYRDGRIHHLGVQLGTQLGYSANAAPGGAPFSVEQYSFTIGLVGALIGLILTPYITTRPVRFVRKLLNKLSTQSLFSGLVA